MLTFNRSKTGIAKCINHNSKETALTVLQLFRPVARGLVGVLKNPPNFQKFTNLVAVIHSLLQLSLIVQRKRCMRKNAPTDVSVSKSCPG